MSFRYRHNTNIRMGNGLIREEAHKIISEYGFKKPFVIVDQGLMNNNQIQIFIDKYEKIFVNTIQEPTYEYLDDVKGNIYHQGFDVIIAIGGGSTMDLAKGIALLATNPSPAISFKGFPKYINTPLPVITIPTLPGTGSEVAFNAVFTDNNNKVRLGINTEMNYPLITLVDPEIAITAPAKALTSSLMDCMLHAVSSYISTNSNPFTRMYSKEAIKYLIEGSKEDEITESLNKYYLASMMANISLNNAGCGLEGSFSGILGAYYDVPHGIAEGILLPYFIDFYLKKGFKGYNEPEDIFGPQLLKAVNDFYKKINAPRNLNQWIKRKDIPKIIKLMKPYYKESPVKYTEKDCEEMLKKVITE